jgi:quercetin dioxygenase-like cupin family protein
MTMKRSALITLAFAAVVALLSAGSTWATPGMGVTATLLQRATTDDRIKFKTKRGESSDLLVQHVALQPGGFSGWHSHPGPKLGAVKSGEIAYYTVASDHERGDQHGRRGTPHCTVQFFYAGDAFVVEAHKPHYIRNEGAVVYEDYSTFVLPVGVPARTDEPAPAASNCPS